MKTAAFLVALIFMGTLFSFILMSQKEKMLFLKGSIKKQAKIFQSKYRTSKNDFLINSDIEIEINDMTVNVTSKIDKANWWILVGFLTLWLPVIIVFIYAIYQFFFKVNIVPILYFT